MCSLKSPEDLDRFVTETRGALGAQGFDEAAAAMAEMQSTGYTTRSEWLGELGATVRRIEAQLRLPSEIQERLDRIMVEVRGAWPTL